MKVIDVQNVFLKYPSAKSDTIRGISFAVQQGEIFGFLGPSGAGKSTMQKILTGTLRNYRGNVRVFDTEMKNRTSDYYENIGVDFEFPNFYSKFTAAENLKYFASLYSRKPLDPMELLEKVGLRHDADKKVADYSKGMKMRLGFVRSLLHEPKLLFLDEPTSGLDPGERVRFRNLLSEFASHDRIVLISTHIVSDVEYIATCNAVMKGGKIQAVGTTEELVTLVNGKVWNGTIPAGQLAEYENRLQIVNLRNEADGRISVRYLAEKPGIEDSVPAVPRLEDLYLWMFPESRFDKEAD